MVEVDGSRVDTSLYRIDYIEGRVQLADSCRGNLKVRYQIFPFPIRREYYHRKKLVEFTGVPVIKKSEDPDTNRGLIEGVRIGGKKTFSVSVGSKDELSLNQSLELRLEGEISGVGVNGVLSDKNSSLTGGGTKSIEELDRMYMEVGSDRFKCRIGDYDLRIEGNRFCNLDRRLEGVMGKISFGKIDAMAAGAITERKFISSSFTGEDGKQGPYQLRDSKGAECWNLVRGTEKVYLDGELLQRGENKDYIIDYEMGTIEFTPRRLITSESRIIVDFQYSDDEFEKRVYGTQLSAGLLNRRLEVSAALFTERDDIKNPLHNSLTEAEWQKIYEEVSDTTEVWIDGGELVGEKKGDYLKIDGHYEYAGANSGDYKVSFTYRGEGKGDYVYNQKKGGYEWVGEGMGSYVARIRLSLPKNRSLYDLKLAYHPISNLSVEYEQAFSERDLNALSKFDEVRRSEAHSLELALRDKPLPWGKLTLSTRLWKVGRGFTPSSYKTGEKEWYDCLNLTTGTIKEAKAVYSLPLLRTSLAYGDLKTPKGGAQLKEFEATVNPDGFPRAFFNYENLKDRNEEGIRFKKRKTVGVSHSLWHFSPSLLYSEEFGNSTRARRYGFVVDLSQIDWLTGRYEHTVINRDMEESPRVLSSEFRELRHILTLFLNTKHTKAEFNCTHRKKRYYQPEGENLDYSLASLSISSVPAGEKLEVSFNTLLTSKKTLVQELVYTRVEEGEGDYIRDPDTGEYHRVDSGDYVRELTWVGDSDPCLGLKVEFQSRLRPTKTLVLSSRFLLDEEVRKRDEFFTMFEGFKGEKLRNLFDNTLEISSSSRRVALRLNHRWNRTFEPSGEETEEVRAIRANIVGKKVDFLIGGSEELTKRGSAAYVQKEEKKRRIEITEILKFYPFTLSFLEGLESKKVRFPHYYENLDWIELISIFITPSIRFEFHPKGSLESKVRIGYSISNHQILPYILTITDPPGYNYEWMTGINYWLNGSIGSNLVYQGEKRGGDVDHKFKAEIRGYF